MAGKYTSFLALSLSLALTKLAIRSAETGDSLATRRVELQTTF